MRSEVAEFFSGKTLFITGGTGFMGKVLLEKLIYSIPGIDTIYVLLRSKRGKSPEARIEEITRENPVFGRVRAECPERLGKIVAVNGDIGLEGLGLSEVDERKLVSNVDIIIHGAASLRLDAKLKDAVHMNVLGTFKLLELAKKCKHLQLMTHLSTAFCHCDIDVLEEKLYPSPHDPHDIIRLTQWLDPNILEKITPDLIKPHPNVYTYTKRLAETLLEAYFPEMPVCIIRPSIVLPAVKEPLPGWVDNMNGPTGLLVGAGKGVIRSMHCNEEYTAEVIPVDMAINGILAIIQTTCSNKSEQETVPVYNLTQGTTRSISWGRMLETGRKCVYANPFQIMLWYPDGGAHKSKAIHNLNVLLFHWLPAYFIDFLLFLFRQKTFMLRVQRRIQGGIDVLQYFTTKEWHTDNSRLLEMRARMNAVDKEKFTLDFEGVDEFSYMTDSILGARHYLMKEDPTSLPRSRRLLKILWVMHITVQLLFGYFIIMGIISYSSVGKRLLDSVLQGFSSAPFLRNIS